MEGNRSSSFSLWFSKETCLIEWYQIHQHICWSFTERHPCIATRPSHQTSLPSRMQIMSYWNSTHVCLLPRHRICRHVCLLHHTSNNVCYNCTQPTRMLGTHALDQCACLLYLYQTNNPAIIATGSVDIFTITHVWWFGIEPAHVWNQDSRPAVIYVTASRDYQACCSTYVFKLCSETAGKFVTVAPGHLAHRL